MAERKPKQRARSDGNVAKRACSDDPTLPNRNGTCTLRITSSSAGEYRDTRHYSASISMGSHIAGSIKATIIKRPGQFYTSCDAVSQELQEVSCILFRKSGAPRYDAIKADPDAGTKLECVYVFVLNIKRSCVLTPVDPHAHPI
jgi:hypothetical protein